MKFLFISTIIILFILTNEEKKCTVYDILKKDSNLTLNSNGYAVYLDTYEFNYNYKIEINITVYNGKFTEYGIYYGGSDEIFYPGVGITIKHSLGYSYSNCGNYSYGSYNS